MELEKATLEDLGQAKRVVINKDTTTIIDGVGEEAAIQGRVAQIVSRLKKRPPTTIVKNCRSA